MDCLKSSAMAALCLITVVLVAARVHGQSPEGTSTLDAGLSALLNSSDNVVLVHVLKDSCEISSSEKCEGLILLNWKGLTEGGTISFSIASGVARLPNRILSRASGQSLR